MATEDGEWGGYIEQPDEGETAVFPAPPVAPADVPPTPPRTPSGGSSFLRGGWRIAAVIVGVAAIAGGVIGVVSSGGKKKTTTSTTQTGLTKAQYIAQADRICASLNPPVEAAYRTYAADFTAGNLSGAQAAAQQFQTGAAAELDSLKALQIPSEGGATVQQMLADEQQLINDLESGSPQSESVQAASAVSAQLQSIAHQYGFKFCGVT